MGWASQFKAIRPYIFSIETPEGSGTAFLFSYNQAKNVVGIATAAHVVERADDWKLPIKIVHYETKEELFISDDERVIFLDLDRDSASIMIFKKFNINIPKVTLPLMDVNKVLNIGVEVGWVGFPSIAHPNLCFFTGLISARLEHYHSYLIDGVAINGVSGGPVFYTPVRSSQRSKPTPVRSSQRSKPKIIGVVTGYMPNRVRGETLPGLLRVQDVTSFHDIIKTIKSIDEAKKERDKQPKKESNPSSDTS